LIQFKKDVVERKFESAAESKRNQALREKNR